MIGLSNVSAATGTVDVTSEAVTSFQVVALLLFFLVNVQIHLNE